MKRYNSRVNLALCLILFLTFNLFLAACGSATSSTATPETTVSPQPTQTVRIYASLPLSGKSAGLGKSLLNAMQLALADTTTNTQVIGNFRIDFVALDNSSPDSEAANTDREKANAQKAAADPDAILYLGPLATATAQASIPILNQAGLAMVSPGATYPGLTKAIAGITKPGEPNIYYQTGKRNFFRLLPTDELQGKADASFTDAKLIARRVFIVDDGTDYGAGLAKAYRDATPEYNLDITGVATLPKEVAKYDEVVNQIRTAKPQAIFFGGYGLAAADFIKKVRAAGVTATLVGGGGMQDDVFLEKAGGDGQGAYASISGTDSAGLSPKGEAFVKAYRAKYGETLQSVTIYGYDAMSVGLAALKSANKKDRAAIIEALFGIKRFNGASGIWNFDANGDTTSTIFSFFVNENQKWAFDSVADTSNNPARPSTPIFPRRTPLPGTPTNAVQPVTPGSSLTKTPSVPQPTAAGEPTPTPTVPPPGATVAPGSQRVDAASQLPPEFRLYKLAGLPTAVYVPPRSAELADQPVTVLFALHGMFGNGGDFGVPLLPFAQKHGLVLVAPTFNYNVNYKRPEVISNENVELSAQLNQLLKELGMATGLKLNEKVLLFGFSRGAQLSHHYAMFYPERVLGAAVLSAGAYTLPLNELNGLTLRFPFGVSNINNFIGHNFDTGDFWRVPFRVQVGAQDDDPREVAREWDPFIGNNRVTRGLVFYQAIRGQGGNANYVLVPNTRHEVNARQVSFAEQFFSNFVGR